MYKITVASKVGDYVINNTGIVYEVTGISISIAFNEQLGEDEIRLLFEVVDACEPEGPFYIISGYAVKPATKEEVDEYILGGNIMNENDSNDYDVDPFEGLFDDIIEENLNFLEDEDIIEENNIDLILDEYLDCKVNIQLFGDEDGRYKKRIEELKGLFEKITSDSIS